MQIEEIIKGTFLEEIFKIAVEGNFGELKEANPVGENEKVINEEMTSLEKACKLYANAKFKEIENVVFSGEKKNTNYIWRSYLAAEELLHRLLSERFKEIPEIRQGWKLIEPETSIIEVSDDLGIEESD